MIKVTVELVSAVSSSRDRHLGTAYIVNDGTGSATVGDYDVTLSQFGKPDVIWRSGKVKNFKRRTLGPWDLLYLALKEIVGERNKT